MDSQSAATRAAALDQLRARRQGSYQAPATPPFPPSHHNGYQSGYQSYAPPAQSRDASGSSQWQGQGHNSSYGNVLVPSSSPPPQEMYNSYNSHNNSYPRPPMPSGSFHLPGFPPPTNNPWSQAPSSSNGNHGVSRGFSQPNHASNTYDNRQPFQHGIQGRQTPSDDANSQRVKRARPDEQPVNAMGSPPSPEIQRPGQRRRVTSLAESSDESVVDVTVANRLAHSRPVDVDTEQKFNRFKFTMPLEPANRVKAAWEESNGSAEKATKLLLDPSWSPRIRKALLAVAAAAPVDVAPAPKVETGRVKEVDEALQANRAAIREKGKKSLIYQSRPSVPDAIKSSPVKPAPSPIKRPSPPPESPIIINRARKRAKKVIDSDSDGAYGGSSDDEKGDTVDMRQISEARALSYLNTAGPAAIQELSGCTVAQAEKILELRPFDDVADLNDKLQQGKKKAGPAGISSRMFNDCVTIFSGYGSVDAILEDCERIGSDLRNVISSWTAVPGDSKEAAAVDDGSLSLITFAPPTNTGSQDCLTSQPSTLGPGIQLKDYQLSGVSWLRLLHRRKLSCILADEMGLGKTAQVISFFASLKEQGNRGPHLVVVPSSTLENWVREFRRFAPSIEVRTYYAGKDERPALRQDLLETQASTHDEGWEVLITTYALAQGDDKDRKFFRRIGWNCCVFDEGHVLKNFQSQRYQALLKYQAHWRLLLTGTPLQNNLQELVSLMNFILPERFADSLDSLRAIFKVKGDHKVTLLAQERVSRAKKMMTPFVLRRRKDQVLKDLPKKFERIEWCDMTSLQKRIYRDTMQRSRKTVLETKESDILEDDAPPKGRKAPPKKKPAAKKDKKTQYAENSANVLMDLRKASLHPMLFRKRFDDEVLSSIVRTLLKEPDFKKRGATFRDCMEDMEVMTDAEIQHFLMGYKSTNKFLLDEELWHDAAKVTVLLDLLGKYKAQDRKVLIFSQFTQVLDILKKVLTLKDYTYLELTGATPVDARQALVDEFSEDDSIPVFLLSTKAGGMGINLTAASVVIMFDQDFNPHNDRQAQDRAYRIGQKVDVDVIKLITKGTIEEDMLRLGQTKLALDEAVAGDAEESEESEAARQMKIGLMNSLRQHFVDDDDVKEGDVTTTVDGKEGV